MSERSHGAVFRANHDSAAVAFDALMDEQMCLDLIHIRDDVFGVRAVRSFAKDRIGCLDQIAKNLSKPFHAAFTVWYESVWGAFRFRIFVQGCQYASLRTDGDEDDQWLDANGSSYEFGPPQVLGSDGFPLGRPSPTLQGPRDPAVDCDMSVAASILGIESLGADDTELFRWDTVFPAIRRNYT